MVVHVMLVREGEMCEVIQISCFLSRLCTNKKHLEEYLMMEHQMILKCFASSSRVESRQ